MTDYAPGIDEVAEVLHDFYTYTPEELLEVLRHIETNPDGYARADIYAYLERIEWSPQFLYHMDHNRNNPGLVAGIVRRMLPLKLANRVHGVACIRAAGIDVDFPQDFPAERQGCLPWLWAWLCWVVGFGEKPKE